MKAYKKFMHVIMTIEDIVLALSTLMVLGLTFGNVIARKLFHHSWGFTEEIVVAVFVLLSLLGAGLAARDEGGLVNLALIPDMVGEKGKKVLNLISTVICLIYSLLLTVMACGRMMNDATKTPILAIPKSFFWVFVIIGGISLILHSIENCIEFQTTSHEKKEDD